MNRTRMVAVFALASLGAGCLLSRPASAVPSPSPNATPGRQSDGSILTSTNQRLTPTGSQTEFPGRPTSSVITRGGRTAVFVTAKAASSVSALNGDNGALVVVDLATGKVLQTYTGAAVTVSQRGIALSPDGRELYTSTGGSSVDATTVNSDGTLGTTRSFALATDPAIGSIQPTGLAVTPDGRHLLVSLNRLNAVADLDPVTGKERFRTAVGVSPQDLALQGGTVWVVEEGGPRPVLGDHAVQSTGTPVVADRYTGAAAKGSVALVDLSTHRVLTRIAVRRNPSALLLSGRYLFVTDTGDDAVSVIDTTTRAVVTTFSTVPHPGLTWGSAPNALTMLPGHRLVVSLGRANALGVWQWSGPKAPVQLLGLVPTAWYPTDVQFDATHQQLVVTNNKGVGSLATGGTFSVPNGSVSIPDTPESPRRVQAYQGSISRLPTPSAGQLRAGAEKVASNNGWEATDRACPRVGVPAKAIPDRLGEPSLIKHVLYVIKENRTYDQILGDEPRGNGLPALAEFPLAVTPNHHLLATQFPLLDNFYDSGSLSADGHQWSVQGGTSDYLERQFGNFSRSYPDQGFDSLDYLPGGFIWEAALAAGKTVTDFGEYTNEDGVNPPQHSDIPSLQGLLVPNYSGFDLQIRDIARAQVFHDNLQDWVRQGVMPDLSLMALPQDHTGGSAPGVETPISAVADNDDGLGRIVHDVSTSPFWKDTMILVEEDDPQAGIDHVDGHRSLFYAISPYAKHNGYVDHTYYTQVNALRTIEQVLGLAPLNELDQAAEPMRSLFTDTPDLTAYSNVEGSQPVINPPLSSLSGIRREWAAWAQHGLALGRDGADPEQLERDIWYSVHNFAVPFPGDTTVLRPGQVPLSGGLVGTGHAGVLRSLGKSEEAKDSDSSRTSLLVRTAGATAVGRCSAATGGPLLAYGQTDFAGPVGTAAAPVARPVPSGAVLAATGPGGSLRVVGLLLLGAALIMLRPQVTFARKRG